MGLNLVSCDKKKGRGRRKGEKKWMTTCSESNSKLRLGENIHLGGESRPVLDRRGQNSA